jgi:hypothetical protein
MMCTGDDSFPDLSKHVEVALKANVTHFSGKTAAVNINVYTSSVPGAALFNRHYANVKVGPMVRVSSLCAWHKSLSHHCFIYCI